MFVLSNKQRNTEEIPPRLQNIIDAQKVNNLSGQNINYINENYKIAENYFLPENRNIESDQYWNNERILECLKIEDKNKKFNNDKEQIYKEFIRFYELTKEFRRKKCIWQGMEPNF